MALTRARVVSGVAGSPRGSRVIRAVLCRPRDAEKVAGDVVEMRGRSRPRRATATAGTSSMCAGGLIDIEFIAQYLQLIHAAPIPEILDTSTARVLDKAWRLGLLAIEDAEVLRPAVRLYHDLTQILRLCLPGPFDPEDGRRRGCSASWRARPTFPISPRSTHSSSRRRPRYARASSGFSAHRRDFSVGGGPLTSSFGVAEAFRAADMFRISEKRGVVLQNRVVLFEGGRRVAVVLGHRRDGGLAGDVAGVRADAGQLPVAAGAHRRRLVAGRHR